jgi:hypothetical protein
LTGGNQEKSFEDIGNPSRPVLRVGLLHRDHPLTNVGRHPGVATSARLDLQTLDAMLPVRPDPSTDGCSADAELFSKKGYAVLFLQIKLDDSVPDLHRIRPGSRT